MTRTCMPIAETERVASHIARAERALRDETPQWSLDRLRMLVRALLLGELAEYRRARRFPINRDFPDRAMPYFVDADGTRCAMAHLLELGGAAALVSRIATARNNAFVRELADESELLAWLDAAGLTVDDAARIQPAYGCQLNSDFVCGAEYGLPGELSTSAGSVGVLACTVLEARSPGTCACDVDAVFGDTGAIAVGARVIAPGTHVPGATILVSLARAPSSPSQGTDIELRDTSNGTLRVHGDLYTRKEHSLSRDQVADAVLLRSREECGAALAAIDPWWGQSCARPASSQAEAGSTSSSGDDAQAEVPPTDTAAASTGCAVGARVSTDATVAILLALVAAILSRRRLASERAPAA